jgi:hypothetical protein
MPLDAKTGTGGESRLSSFVRIGSRGKLEKEWRVGKLAHGSLRSRCPRAAPNPFFRHYAPALGASMGRQSHATGYEGSSTARL